MQPARTLTLLGATGSIGTSTLSVVARHRGRFRVAALAAHDSHERLARQCLEFEPEFAVLVSPEAAERLERALRAAGSRTRVLAGTEALVEVASLPQVDTVMAGIVGAAGLAPTLAAVRAGQRVLLANKEALVMAGALFMTEVRACGAVLLPVDSEHNAIHQALPREFAGDLAAVGVRRILLTASGGPFRLTPLEVLERVTPEQACAHPNWVMGRKISVDSATMMNKGLEVIEAHWLFGASAQRIEVVVHPQSIVHSLVEYVDGSVLAQLGQPDMRTPIAYALMHPERIDAGVETLDLMRAGRLDFEAPDPVRFPCLKLAAAALDRGGTTPALLNAANEEAVAAFLERRIGFTDIARVIEEVLGRSRAGDADSLETVLEADRSAREMAVRLLARRSTATRSGRAAESQERAG